VVFYSPLAEIVGQYLRKGSSVFVEGRLQTRKWQDKTSGQDRYTTEIIANEMKMLGGRGGAGGSAPFTGEGPEMDSTPAPRPPQGQAQPPARPTPPQSGPDNGGFDDDIPF
jgi:single-strand DNA-binding protein